MFILHEQKSTCRLLGQMQETGMLKALVESCFRQGFKVWQSNRRLNDYDFLVGIHYDIAAEIPFETNGHRSISNNWVWLLELV